MIGLARLAMTLNAMLDRLEDALAREHRLVDDASHELRTPLANMRAEVELALDRPRSPAELERALAGIAEDIASLQRLTDDLLVLARSRGGSVPLRRRPTSLRELVESAVEAVSLRARARHIEIGSSVEDVVVPIDPERVRQALLNLLDNALRYTPEGGSVRIEAAVHDGVATIVVRDSGPGFPRISTSVRSMPSHADPRRTAMPGVPASGWPSSARSPRHTRARCEPKTTAAGA